MEIVQQHHKGGVQAIRSERRTAQLAEFELLSVGRGLLRGDG